MDIWKQFEQNTITHSAAHHLMAVDSLIRLHGYARVSDVARLLEITPGSVSLSLKPLKAADFVQQDENRFLRLSPAGQHLVDILRARRSIIVRFLSGLLGVDERQAEVDSCKIEHLLSADTARALTDFLRYVTSARQAGQPGEALLDGLARFDRACPRDAAGPHGCPCLAQECLGGAGLGDDQPDR